MSDAQTVPLGQYAEVRIYPQQAGTDDASDMYVMDTLGVTVLVRRRADGSTYVHVDTDGRGALIGELVYEIRNGGEHGAGERYT